MEARVHVSELDLLVLLSRDLARSELDQSAGTAHSDAGRCMMWQNGRNTHVARTTHRTTAKCWLGNSGSGWWT